MLFFIYVLRFLYTVDQVKAIAPPCISFDSMDLTLLGKNQKDLYSDPISYYKSPMLKKCNMKYVDMSRIRSHGKSPYLWIAYIGDSLSRELFVGAIQRISGFKPNLRGNWEDELKYSPPLGVHLGPIDDHDIGDFKLTYHKSKLLCCRRYGDHKNHLNASEPCLFAIARDESYPPDILAKYHFYFYRDMATYIDSVVSPVSKYYPSTSLFCLF